MSHFESLPILGIIWALDSSETVYCRQPGTYLALTTSMENYFLKPFIVFFFLFMTIVTHSKEATFEIKPFVTTRSTSEQITSGLLTLFKNKISDEDLKKQIELSDQFQNSVYELLEQKILSNKMISVSTQEKILTGNFVKETTVRFASLVQRPGNHAANQVVAKIYEPTVKRPYCEFRYPTSIFLHHILNELPMIQDLAKVMASGVLHQPGIIVILHMPHYGDRRQGEEEFLTSDLKAFRENIKQLILDVHMLKNYVETRENVNSDKFSLTGISLGAVMGLTVGAFDQSFTGYGNLVGGVDLANIIYNRATNRPGSEVAKAMKDLEMNESAIRKELAAIDSMTWLHRYQNKKIFALNASRDDIINHDVSVVPMLATFKQNGNRVEEKLNNDTHQPTGSFFKKMKHVFGPMLDFIIDGSPTYENSCPDNINN